MHNLLFVLDCMVENNIQPIFTNIQFCDWIILDNLENQIICSVENDLKCLVFCFLFLENLFKDFYTHLFHNRKKFITNFQIFCNILFLFVWQCVLFNFGNITIFDESNQFLKNRINVVEVFCFQLVLNVSHTSI